MKKEKLFLFLILSLACSLIYSQGSSSSLLTLTCNQQVVYQSKGFWFWNVTLANESNYDFNITAINIYYYDDAGELRNSKTFNDKTAITNFFGTTQIKAKSNFYRHCGTTQAGTIQVKQEYIGELGKGKTTSVTTTVKLDQDDPCELLASSKECKNPEIIRTFRLPLGLGVPSYSPDEIATLATLDDPALLKDKITTVYDLLAVLRQRKYGNRTGDTKVEIGSRTWHINNKPDTTLRINEGNCGGDANLFKYLLDGDYEEVGFVHYNKHDGGHVFNYVKQAQKYYIIDLVQYNFRDELKLAERWKTYEVVELDSLAEYVAICKSVYSFTEGVIFTELGLDNLHCPLGDDWKDEAFYVPQAYPISVLSLPKGWAVKTVQVDIQGYTP